MNLSYLEPFLFCVGFVLCFLAGRLLADGRYVRAVVTGGLGFLAYWAT